MKKCDKGISGGMSIIGTLASLVGASAIAALALAFARISINEALIVILSGFLGAVLDSALGSLLQVKYKCKKCGLILEKEEHCSERTTLHSGIPFVTNDTVNLLGTTLAALIAALIYNI